MSFEELNILHGCSCTGLDYYEIYRFIFLKDAFSLCFNCVKLQENLLTFDEFKISFMTLTSDHTFFPPPESIALQNCEQQNNNLSLCLMEMENI